MLITEELVRSVHRRTDGRCHVCGKRRALKNHGRSEKERGWEIDHSVAKAKGGTNHRNNLFVACTSCNRSKGTRPSRAARARHGRSCAPLSRERKQAARRGNTVAGGIVGGLVGLAFGPVGMALGAVTGACIGNEVEVE